MSFSAIEHLTAAFTDSRILHTAVVLDVFSAVAEGASAAEVAATRQLDPRATELLLNALTGLELLHKQDGCYALTEAARTHLLPGSDRDFSGMVAFDAAAWPFWERLPEAVRSGQPARPQDMFQSDPADTRRFILAMDSLVRARGDATWLAANLELDGVTRVLDVGSGPGTYPIALARAHLHLECTIFDLPGTLAVTREVVADAEMTDRIELIPGDYNSDPLPGGYDLVLMSNVLHLEDEPRCERLLATCACALNPGGYLVVKDHVMVADRTRPAGAAVFSMMMLLMTRGRDYSFDEIAGWMIAAGLEKPVQTPLPPPFSSSLVTARKPR